MRVSDLTKACLRQHPVWTWDESRDFYVPIATTEPLPTDTDTLFVSARFTTPSGKKFEGYIVDPDGPFAVRLLVREDSVGFNLNAPEFMQQSLDRLFELMHEAPFRVFPLVYETDFHYLGEPNIAGVFEYDAANEQGEMRCD